MNAKGHTFNFFFSNLELKLNLAFLLKWCFQAKSNPLFLEAFFVEVLKFAKNASFRTSEEKYFSLGWDGGIPADIDQPREDLIVLFNNRRTCSQCRVHDWPNFPTNKKGKKRYGALKIVLNTEIKPLIKYQAKR